MRCTRKTDDGKQCDFKLMALRKEGTMQIYAHSKHNHTLLESEGKGDIVDYKI
jgi:hypothetical protein